MKRRRGQEPVGPLGPDCSSVMGHASLYWRTAQHLDCGDGRDYLISSATEEINTLVDFTE